MNIFNAAEVVDIGIEKEKKRRDFYAMVAELFKEEKDMNDLFTKLRDWESTHIEKFTEIRNRLQEYETFETYEGELEDYMTALVDEKLYDVVTPEIFAKKIKKPIDAINYGMSFEKDAILFFEELLPNMRPVNSASIQALIDEEKKHLIYLYQLKKNIGKK
jgi:rubrerythrin